MYVVDRDIPLIWSQVDTVANRGVVASPVSVVFSTVADAGITRDVSTGWKCWPYNILLQPHDECET
jgi:hypothetical protein